MPLTDGQEARKSRFAQMSGRLSYHAGRGGHVVEDDLLGAINSGHLSGASLDVFEQEPLPDNHAFWGHPHITIWPHVAAQTNPQTASEQVARALVAFAEGTTPDNMVDKDRGY